MAGLYPDIPGTRFALDLDGTVAKVRATNQAWNDVTGQLANAVTTSPATYIDLTSTAGADWELALAFPEPRDINGLFVEYGASGQDGGVLSGFQYSTDTTDGTDGTWTSGSMLGEYKSNGGSMKPFYRSLIGIYSLSNIKGVRLSKTVGDVTSSNWRIFALHLYGSRSISGVDRVEFWDPTTDQRLGHAYLDFGDNPQGTQITRQFRIKNLSASLTANDVTVAASDLANDFGGNVELSTDNTTFLQSINIGNLAAGVISATLYIRRTTQPAETPTQRSMRLIVTANSWT